MIQRFFILFLSLLLFAFSGEHVELSLPKHFPKPVYSFSSNPITQDGFKLGRKLFYDPILSRDHFVSCGSCHQQFAAFAHIDHALAHGIYGKIGKRNVPALQNLIWYKNFMADGGINHLEVQPLAPITNPIEMDLTLPEMLARLKSDSVYRELFSKVYGDTMINTARVMKVLVQFIGSMISSDSKYDQVMNGKAEFNEKEEKGYKLFKKNCSSCHAEPLFTNQEFVNIGLSIDKELGDSGRYIITGLPKDINRFNVPSLRNVQRTYPYMHDGRFRTLEESLNFYTNKPHQTADARIKKIKITQDDIPNLIAFLYTLTDMTFLYDRRFSEQ